MATDRMNESWRMVRSKIETIWSEADFDDQEMKKARGNMKKMITLIHEKTGEPRSQIRQKISAVI